MKTKIKKIKPVDWTNELEKILTATYERMVENGRIPTSAKKKLIHHIERLIEPPMCD